MNRNPLLLRFRNAVLIVLWLALLCASAATAQQPPPEDAAPPAASVTPPADRAPILSGKGPLRLPAPAAKPVLPVSRPFVPSEQVRADADVAFPADI